MNTLLTEFLPFFFAGTLLLTIFIYVISDGYDLGIGMLFPLIKKRADHNAMVDTIEPFWDGNETWIVISIGLLFIAFPTVYGLVLSSIYIPVVLMLMGFILRGSAFGFRSNVNFSIQAIWNKLFSLGSYLAAFSQGVIIAFYLCGLNFTVGTSIFAFLIGISVCMIYALLGATWLIAKLSGELRVKALYAAKKLLIGVLGIVAFDIIVALSFITPIQQKWISSGILSWIILAILLGIFLLLSAKLSCLLKKISKTSNANIDLSPYLYVFLMILTIFVGIGYTVFPDIILNVIDIRSASSVTSTLLFSFWGVAIVIPIILLYTAYTHFVFKGKLGTDEK